MSEFLQGRDLQRQTLRLYGELLLRNPSLAGKLIFSASPGSSTSGLAAAVSILGGTSLIVDPDAAIVRSVLRQGGIDFVVNTLDEALRVLKNEIRKHTPLSVALVADVTATMAEMFERGVVPDVEVQILQESSGMDEVASDMTLRLLQGDGIVEPSRALSRWLEENAWEEQVLEVDSIGALRSLDVQLISTLDARDNVRMRWMRHIAQYQRPSAETGRVVWLTPAEYASLRG